MDRHRELKQAYKQTPRPMGVFKITNKQNGKILIGTSMNLDGIFNRYLWQGNGKSLFNKGLQEDWNELGSEGFSFEILETLKWEEWPQADWKGAVAVLEEEWLERLQPYGDKGYNIKKQK